MLLLRVKRVNQESLEEMGCLAKKEYQDYQESRCVSLCASVCVPVVDCVCSVHCAVFIRSSSVSSLWIWSSGYCWTSRPGGLKGGAGRQRPSREGENTLKLPSSLGLKGQSMKLVLWLLLQLQNDLLPEVIKNISVVLLLDSYCESLHQMHSTTWPESFFRGHGQAAVVCPPGAGAGWCSRYIPLLFLHFL